MKYPLTANGTTATHRAAKALVRGTGTFGGGTVTLEYFDAGANEWIASRVTYTENFDDIVEFPTSVEMRLTLSGATTPNLELGIISG